jgi:hypothetical protein
MPLILGNYVSVVPLERFGSIKKAQWMVKQRHLSGTETFILPRSEASPGTRSFNRRQQSQLLSEQENATEFQML